MSSKGSKVVGQYEDTSIQQHVFSKVVSQPSSYDVQKTCHVVSKQMSNVMDKQHSTVRSRCGYNSNVDKKCVEGLLVRHNYKKKIIGQGNHNNVVRRRVICKTDNSDFKESSRCVSKKPNVCPTVTDDLAKSIESTNIDDGSNTVNSVERVPCAKA